MASTMVIATAGYVLAGWEWVDAIYMVTITIFGVGYGEVHPVNDPALKLFTIAVIVAGCSSGIYVIGGILQMVTEGEVKRMLGVQSRSREIESLSDHAIICGYGRVGKMLANNLIAAGKSFIILDQDPQRVEQAAEDGLLAYAGDAVDDAVLLKAGIDCAKSLST
ncbi:MAG: potassium channel family protein, partial [Planctomycetota bacterium]